MPTFAKREMEARDDGDDLPFGYVEDDGYAVPWWYSSTGVIVKWTIFILIVVLFFGWIIGGYLHAKSRLKKGLMPLRYHRCLVSRRQLAQVDPSYAYPRPQYSNYPNNQPNGYPMHNMPPPIYDPSRPPMYEGPPEGGSKVDPAQSRMDPSRPIEEHYAPPPGPPPAMR
ncbi:Fc.00g016770.m01.CDS01 [Cosmosporella sp. VM-42]